MGWTWSDLHVLDNWAAPSEATREAVLVALAELMDHADLIEGEPIPGQRAPVRRIVVEGTEIVFLRADQFRTLRLLAVRPAG